MPKSGPKSAPKNAPKTMLESLDSLIERYYLLKHPFYQAWTAGKLSKESLQLYAAQYYQHVRAFPENLSQLAKRSTGNLQTLVKENLAEELDPVAPHPMLWREFAASLGVSDSELDSTRVLPGIAALLDTFDEVSFDGSMAQAVAMFYSYEAQVPGPAVLVGLGVTAFILLLFIFIKIFSTPTVVNNYNPTIIGSGTSTSQPAAPSHKAPATSSPQKITQDLVTRWCRHLHPGTPDVYSYWNDTAPLPANGIQCRQIVDWTDPPWGSAATSQPLGPILDQNIDFDEMCPHFFGEGWASANPDRNTEAEEPTHPQDQWACVKTN